MISGIISELLPETRDAALDNGLFVAMRAAHQRLVAQLEELSAPPKLRQQPAECTQQTLLAAVNACVEGASLTLLQAAGPSKAAGLARDILAAGARARDAATELRAWRLDSRPWRSTLSHAGRAITSWIALLEDEAFAFARLRLTHDELAWLGHEYELLVHLHRDVASEATHGTALPC